MIYYSQPKNCNVSLYEEVVKKYSTSFLASKRMNGSNIKKDLPIGLGPAYPSIRKLIEASTLEVLVLKKLSASVD